MRFNLSLVVSVSLAVLAVAKPHQQRHGSRDCDSTHTTHSSTSWSTRRTSTPTWAPSRPSTVTTTEWEPEPTVTVTRTETTTKTATTTTVSTERSGGNTHRQSSSLPGSLTVASAPPQSSPTATALPSATSGSSSSGSSGAIPAGECNTGSIQCCDQVEDAKSDQMSSIISSLGIDPLSAIGLAGTSCSPIDVLGLGGGTSCNQMPVCCNNNTFQGLINIGCVPIIVDL
ncbi:fungal hydrophobin-domain-containing protein [Cubamyces lactineus]|nr:fungal hydrophobin-domain-containing protein [Cubamyces lactineus]